ncbi:MAG: hypothetical protein QW057_01655 [Candidatus Bathyarchaeia archaeon]
MELEVVKEFRNVLMGRREVEFLVKHPSAATPSRYAVREALAGKYGGRLDCTYVMELVTKTGTHTSSGLCYVYDDAAKAKALVPTYVQNKNLPPQERVKAKGKKA